MEPIKNLVLDLGGVLLDLDERSTYRAFVHLGLRNIPPDLACANLDFQRGKITREQFADILRRYLPAGTSREQVYGAWCAMLGDVPPRRLALLEKWRQRYRLFLLSNTDDIHIDCLRHSMDLDRLEGLFDRVYYSQRTGFRKPQREIFELVLRENGLQAPQTLFVDDTQENVAGALSVGMRAVWLDISRYSLEDLPSLCPEIS